MSNFEVLDNHKHKKLRVGAELLPEHCKSLDSATLCIDEVASLSSEYAIFLAKNPATGRFVYKALLGTQAGENLYVHQGLWRALQMPMEVLIKPFRLYRPEGQERGVLSLDINSDLLRQETGASLFTDTGEPSPYLERIKAMFSQFLAAEERERDINRQFEELALIEPVTLNLEILGQANRAIDGFYGVNTQALNRLSGDDLKALNTTGGLHVLFSLINASNQLDKLMRWRAELSKG